MVINLQDSEETSEVKGVTDSALKRAETHNFMGVPVVPPCRKPKFRGVEEQKNGKGVITGEYPEAKRRGRLSDGKFKEMRTFFRLQGS